MSVLSDDDKAKIDSMSDTQLRIEVVKGRDSVYQGDKMARITARLSETDAQVLRTTNKIAIATLIIATVGVVATILVAIFA